MESCLTICLTVLLVLIIIWIVHRSKSDKAPIDTYVENMKDKSNKPVDNENGYENLFD